MLRSILHCDMNNFYASVECMLDPALKKYPIAVCGSVEERHGIVLAKNYKAKAFDVKTGDAVRGIKMESERRKVYVEVNVTHRPDGTARPNFIKFENDEKYEIDRVIQKCRAASTKVGGTGIRYTVQICGKPTFLFDEENGKWFVEAKS